MSIETCAVCGGEVVVMARKGSGICGQRCADRDADHRRIAREGTGDDVRIGPERPRPEGSADLANAAEPVHNEPECAVPDEGPPAEVVQAAKDLGREMLGTPPEVDLRTPDAWSREFGVRVVDPDGWGDGLSWDTAISRAEFQKRLAESTQQDYDWDLGQPVMHRPKRPRYVL